MHTRGSFEVQVMIAAEKARRAGFNETHLALLDVLRAARCNNERVVGSLKTPASAAAVRISTEYDSDCIGDG